MQHDADMARRFDDLPDKTKEFFSKLDEEDVETLDKGLKLVRAVLTVGTFMKWLIVGVLGLFVGFVMFLESFQKIVAWLRS
ncbi:MAG: hypothetical protein R3E51_10425 [Rhizobiaceae bacterium]